MGKRGPTTGLSIDTLRPQIYARDGYVCQYCGTTVAENFIIEHVVPIEEGPTHPANLVVACRSCNQRKGAQVWRPQNFAIITAEYPEWAEYVLSRIALFADVTPKAPLTEERAVASYKVNTDVKRQFARFAKWYNRERDPSEEIEIGMLAQEALEDLMQKYGYQEAAG